MHRPRLLARSLWLLVTVAVGISFVGRPLAMRAGVLEAQEVAEHQAMAGGHAGMAGHGGMPMPCPQHSGQCCAPCLACCAGCVTLPLPAVAQIAGTVVATVRLAGTDRAPVTAPRSSARFLQPPPIGPPTPLVS
jgi:hypothetical protein